MTFSTALLRQRPTAGPTLPKGRQLQCEPPVVALRQHAVLVPPHPVDALVQVHLDVEPVVHDVGVRHLVAHGLAERGGHVHGDAADHVLLRRVQRLVDERLRAVLAAAARHVEDPVVVEVGHDAREVVGLLAVQEALLVHPDERDLVRLAPRQAALHGGLHDVARLQIVSASDETSQARILGGEIKPGDDEDDPYKKYIVRFADAEQDAMNTPAPAAPAAVAPADDSAAPF